MGNLRNKDTYIAITFIIFGVIMSLCPYIQFNILQTIFGMVIGVGIGVLSFD